jgi:hypothetical protein
MYVKNFVEYIIVAICGSISIFVHDNFGFSGFEVVLYPAIAASFTYIILTFSVDHINSTNYVRKYYDKRAKYEGTWIERIENRKIILNSIFSIRYDRSSDNYAVYGVALDQRGELYSTWNSKYVEIDITKNEIRYSFEAEKVADSGIIGYSVLSFFSKVRKEMDYGKGYFVDMGNELQRCDFKFSKIDENLIMELIGEKYIRSHEQLKDFIIEYHKKFGQKRNGRPIFKQNSLNELIIFV